MSRRLAFTLFCSLLCAGAAGSVATSGLEGGSSTPIIRDGLWAGPTPGWRPRTTYPPKTPVVLLVGVGSHRVVYLRFVLPLLCTNRDTNEEYWRVFIAQGRYTDLSPVFPVAIPANGLLVKPWVEVEALREGQIKLTLDWRGTRDQYGRSYPLVAIVKLFVPRSAKSPEECYGIERVPARRTGPLPREATTPTVTRP